MDEKAVLRKAKEVLLERGWRNDGKYGDAGGGKSRVCLLGACGVAIEGSAYYFAGCYQSDHPVLEVLGKLVPLHPRDARVENRITEWNDEWASFEDIIDLLDSAIAQLEPSKTPELVA